MIAVDTNVLVRYLVADHPAQARIARERLAELSTDRPGFICREVMIELVWVLRRAYGFSREQICREVEELLATEELEIEAAHDTARAIHRYRRGDADFADFMILGAAQRTGASTVWTFDRSMGRLDGVSLLDAADSQARAGGAELRGRR